MEINFEREERVKKLNKIDRPSPVAAGPLRFEKRRLLFLSSH